MSHSSQPSSDRTQAETLGVTGNSLGMKFLPVPGTRVLFSVWETRVRDYQRFVEAKRRSWEQPEFAEYGPDHPAVNVSWQDAKDFCLWLTEEEQRAGRLGIGQYYALPSDADWSKAVGLEFEAGGTPEDNDGKTKGIYPWGRQWPAPVGAGNYDSSLSVDSFSETSPVGRFAANQFGLHDMGGNVWEWCEDRYESRRSRAGFEARVLRGASWRNFYPDGMLSSYRDFEPPDHRSDYVGFRCVLVGVSAR